MAAHERQCFATGCGLSSAQFRVFNAAVDDFETFDIGTSDVVMIGGSGDFSLAAGGFEWHGPFLKLIGSLLEKRIPIFGSCFGFQALGQALGGKVVSDTSTSEVGTYSIAVTDDGGNHPTFADLPARFDAQLGHNDSVRDLPDSVIHLARSQRCEYQALAMANAPVVATQFHPELTRQGSLERFENYLQSYKDPEQDIDEAMAYAHKMHRPSPQACSLLRTFLEQYVIDAKVA